MICYDILGIFNAGGGGGGGGGVGVKGLNIRRSGKLIIWHDLSMLDHKNSPGVKYLGSCRFFRIKRMVRQPDTGTPNLHPKPCYLDRVPGTLNPNTKRLPYVLRRPLRK